MVFTFSDATVVAPPIPVAHRAKLKRIDDWLWSSRPDINAMQMYLFEHYIQESMMSSVSDYSAISHAGHGVNSYSLNIHIVRGPIGLFIQSAWGGVYNDPVRENTRIATAFWLTAKLLAFSEGAEFGEELTTILSWSSFRSDARHLYIKDESWRLISPEETDVVLPESRQRIDGDPFDRAKDLKSACSLFLKYLSS
jgi:hypothetical protein